MKNFEEQIPETLKKVFDELTRKSIKFYDWYGYKTAEIEVVGIRIGIGINSNYSSIKLFGLKSNGGDDYRKFYQTFRIGNPDGSLNSLDYWNIELAQGMLYAKNFSLISQHFYAASEIVKMIEEDSKGLVGE